MKNHSNITRILLAAFLVETLCATYALYLQPLIKYVSILHTLSGLVIAYALLWMQPAAVTNKNRSSSINTYRWILMGMALMVITHFSRQFMTDDPINYVTADMLPIITKMCGRFLAGDWMHVYDPIPEIWNGIHPIYLSAMWMPYAVPILLHIDIRWITVGSLFMVFCLFIWKLHPLRRGAWLAYACTFLLFWWLLAVEKAGLIPFTEEGIVILYYVLLCMALLNRNTWLIGIAVSLCVLSRYSLIGWLPAMILYYVYNKEWRNLLRFALTGITCLVLLQILPFGWDVFVTLSKLPGEYVAFTDRVWSYAPGVFLENLGLAKFFGRNNIALQHSILIYSSFILPLLSMLFCLWLQKRKGFSMHNIPLVVLKITLVVFYTLVDVPYLYLFYTSSFVSVIAVAYFLERGSLMEGAKK